MMTPRDKKAVETIICPNCETHQDATAVLREGAPFWAYVHTCVVCGYTIMESEWQPVCHADALLELANETQ